MKKIYLLLISIVCGNVLNAQTLFQKYLAAGTFFGPVLAVCETPTGYAAVGDFSLGTDNSGIVVTDFSGNLVNAFEFITPDLQGLNDVVASINGGTVSAGYSINSTFTSGSALVIKNNATGGIQWAKIYGNGSSFAGARNIIEDPSGNNYFVAGTTNNAAGDNDILLMQLNSNGALMQQKTFGTKTSLGAPYADELTHFIRTSDGGLLVLGFVRTGTGPSGQGSNMCFIKTDASLNHQWTKIYSDPLTYVGYQVIEKAGGNLLVCGRREDLLGHQESFAAEFNATGDFQWMKGYSVPGDTINSAQAIAQNSSNTYAITGYNSYGMYTFEIDNLGSVNWSKNYNQTGGISTFDIIKTTDGKLLQAGAYSNLSASYVPYLQKINSTGAPLCGDSTFTLPSITRTMAGASQIPDTAVTNFTDQLLTLTGTALTGWNNECAGTGFLEEEHSSFALSIFPNPSSGKINVQLKNIFYETEISLFDIAGKKMRSVMVNPAAEVKALFENLEAGIYFITVASGNEMRTQKFIVATKN